MEPIDKINSFIADSRVDEIVYDLKSVLMKDGKMPVYSDIYKEEDGKIYQYVNYVQEGGGVLGIALVGYTYVLEKLGFRFAKLAGTSAGAINTILLASINKENYPKLINEKVETQSEIILHELLSYDLWNLVDGSKFGRLLINLAVNKMSRLIFFILLLITSLIIPLGYAVINCVSIVFDFTIPQFVMSIIFYTTVLSILILLVGVFIILYYLNRFDRSGFGINPGNTFYDWIKNILNSNKVQNSDDLQDIMKKRFQGLKLRHTNERLQGEGIESTTEITLPYLTIVTSDITNQIKVEFPSMAKEYWSKEDLESLNPATFVRASMSIPIFFSPLRVDVNEEVIANSYLQQERMVSTQFSKIKSKQNDLTSYKVRFVDGGILSNFPISVFHNPNIKIARMPTFGVRLEDKPHLMGGRIEKLRLKFFPFLYRIFNTVRFNYDKDFLKKYAVYQKCIGHIDVSKFNWLDFGLNNEEKIAMFRKGAEAAKTFLLGGDVWIDGRKYEFGKFDWEKFKRERSEIAD
ncbi:MAG: patatin-like phospholipase family protein [Bacteroidetes bacterium]|nr:patatin-like phospholipase family protein [Bacteroidota bacterium]MBK9672772.1 patatin-like phospholipase family protein [Bacteroidota bacterium]MBK9800887.1 patatin-like phospholipase family protein [Bacteroidota bacterium]MBP6412031.1 patatin-like phospholipase family protein [Bacteroidia bacterium]